MLERPGCTGIAGSQVLILACGNPLRGDDGAGLALAEQLAAYLTTAGQPNRLLLVHQYTPELALEIADGALSNVFFVDTRASSRGDHAPLRIDVERLIAASPNPIVGHHLAPQTLLLYARELYGHAPAAWLITVPGINFDHGTEWSAPVQALLVQSAQVVEVAEHLLQCIKRPPSSPPTCASSGSSSLG